MKKDEGEKIKKIEKEREKTEKEREKTENKERERETEKTFVLSKFRMHKIYDLYLMTKKFTVMFELDLISIFT